MNRYVVIGLILFVSLNVTADEKPKTPAPAKAAPVLKGAGSVDLEDLLAKNPIPADAKGPLHLVPIARGRAPGSGVPYQVAGLHARGELPLHFHRRRAEIVYVIAGGGTFTLGTESITLKPGMVLHIPAKTPHGFKLDADGRVFIVTVGPFDPKDFVGVGASRKAVLQKILMRKGGIMNVFGGTAGDMGEGGLGGVGVGRGRGADRRDLKSSEEKQKSTIKTRGSKPGAKEREPDDVVTPSTKE
ncbi:MAG: cupin domain-containing protein [Deltaproteobacteria bacterium]|nr:cupin domain-containing protein [Deltaproteobacteria bacterium]